jgi:hypothetical protein
MKKFLLASVMVLTVVSSANARPIEVNTLPQSMHGEWCYNFNVGKFAAHIRRQERGCPGLNPNREIPGDKTMECWDCRVTINSMHISEHESGCNINKIWEIARGRVYRVEMKCGGEGDIYKSKMTLNISEDRSILYFSDIWMGKSRSVKIIP